MDRCELIIQNGSTLNFPAIKEDMTLERPRKDAPGKLDFTVLKQGNLDFQEGNPIIFKWDEDNTFFGFVFTKKRNKDGTIKVTAYDQLRYLKNKDTCGYKNKTAAQLVSMIATDFNLQLGFIEDTGYVIGNRSEDNKTLFDMIKNALDLTLINTKKIYVLYDDFGKLTLKNIESMKLPIIIDNETAEDFDYTSTIDSQTYNIIKLSYENKDTGQRETYVVKDTGNINNWGVLQYFENIQEATGGKAKADALLSLYNRKARNLAVQNCLGDIRVRGGNAVLVNLNLGDIIVQTYMVVENVKHKFKNNEHLMDLTLRGGEFIA